MCKNDLSKVSGGNIESNQCPKSLNQMSANECTICGYKIFQYKDGDYNYYKCPFVDGMIEIISKFNGIND